MDVDYSAAKEYLKEEHYYGRVVRKLFLSAGIVMLFSLPLFSNLIPASAGMSLAAIVALGIVAGFLNPLSRWVVVLHLALSLAALIVFEQEAILSYGLLSSQTGTLFFAVNQLLALNFFFATYYAAKSVRGLFVKGKIVR